MQLVLTLLGFFLGDTWIFLASKVWFLLQFPFNVVSWLLSSLALLGFNVLDSYWRLCLFHVALHHSWPWYHCAFSLMMSCLVKCMMFMVSIRDFMMRLHLADSYEPSEAWQAKLKEVEAPGESICSICLEPLSVLKASDADHTAECSGPAAARSTSRSHQATVEDPVETQQRRRQQDLDRFLEKILHGGPHTPATVMALLGEAFEEATYGVQEYSDEWEQEDWRVGVWQRCHDADTANQEDMVGEEEDLPAVDVSGPQGQDDMDAPHSGGGDSGASVACSGAAEGADASVCRTSSACQLPCGHIFCRPCITGWLQRQQVTCPMCRKEVVPQRKQFNFYVWLFDFPSPSHPSLVLRALEHVLRAACIAVLMAMMLGPFLYGWFWGLQQVNLRWGVYSRLLSPSGYLDAVVVLFSFARMAYQCAEQEQLGMV